MLNWLVKKCTTCWWNRRRICPFFCFLPFQVSLIYLLLLYHNNIIFSYGGGWRIDEIFRICVLSFSSLYFLIQSVGKTRKCRERDTERRKIEKKKNIFPNAHQQMYFVVINTNGVCQIWPGIHLYGPCFVYCSCVCIYSLYNHNDRWCAIGIGADLFSLSFFLAPPPL